MRFIYMFMIFTVLHSQETYVKLHKVYSNNNTLNTDIYSHFNTSFSLNELDTFLKQKTKDLVEQGALFTTIHIDDILFFTKDSIPLIDLFLRVDETRQISLDTVLFVGNKQTKARTLFRETRLLQNAIILPEQVAEARKWLEKSPYVRSVNGYEYIKKGKQSGLLFYVEETDVFYINGILGYNPSSTSSKLSSDFEMDYKNIAGSGRSTSLKWKRIHTNNEDLELSYTEPWLFGSPITTELNLKKMFRDSSFTTWNYHVDGKYALNTAFSIFVGYTYSKTTPVDSAKASQLSLPVNETTRSSFSIEYTTVSSPINPRRGLFTKLMFSAGKTTLLRPTWLLQRFEKTDVSKSAIELDSRIYFEVAKNQVGVASFFYNKEFGEHRLESEKIYFGGVKRLRGYREFEFRSFELLLATVEYRFLLDDISRFYFFSDAAWFNSQKRFSFGLGVQFKTGLGIFSVSYGVPNIGGFSDGKIHFGIVSSLN